MHLSEQTISPKQAQELLDKHWVKERQRTPSPSVVDDYARAMRSGQWMLTHQGIAIDDKGELIDGVHRLLAIAQAGVPIKLVIAKGVHSNGANGKNDMMAIDAIDRGRLRAVGQQLQLRHGYANGNLVASVAWTILASGCHASGIYPGRSSTGKALQVLDCFGSEIKLCVANRSTLPGLRAGSVTGAFALAMRACPAEVKDAYSRFVSGEGLHRGDPMHTLRNYLLSGNSRFTGGSTQISLVRATLQALNKTVAKETCGAIKSQSDIGLNYFIGRQRQTFNRLLAVCGYLDRKGAPEKAN